MPITIAASYLLAMTLVPIILHFKLLPAVLAGLTVHVLTAKMAGLLPPHWNRVAREVALGVLVMLVMALVLGAGFGLWSFLQGDGVAALVASAAEAMYRLKQSLPSELAAMIPDSAEALRTQATLKLREYGEVISVAGLEGVKLAAHILIGMVIGGMTSVYHFKNREHWTPFTSALQQRLGLLTSSFEKVVIAQASISLLNTALTGIFLCIILPLCGVQLPMRTVLVVLTFICGLLPIVGNLVSNSLIVLIGCGTSPIVGASSLLFLMLVHKAEYFLNARIIGHKVHASAFELLCCMLLMESVFGLNGLIAAPVCYSWLKSELKTAAVI